MSFIWNILENTNKLKWIRPSNDQIALEYKIEYILKPELQRITNNAFPSLESFKKAVDSAEVVEVTPSMDKKIQNRSRTENKEELLSLVQGYASWPEFRNVNTIDSIYKAFEKGGEMFMPFVIETKNEMRVMAGNTRMDVAFQMGINPKVLLIRI